MHTLKREIERTLAFSELYKHWGKDANIPPFCDCSLSIILLSCLESVSFVRGINIL